MILGETAYRVERRYGRDLGIVVDEHGQTFRLSCYDGVCFSGGFCKFGTPEDHARLEGSQEEGGTVQVATCEGRPVWQHRVFELRCRVCNRDRVASHRRAHRLKGQSVIGSTVATNYVDVEELPT